MDLNPYLNLLLERKAEKLSLITGMLPSLTINNELKPFGKMELASATSKEIVSALLSELQKKQLIQDKRVVSQSLTT